MVTLLLKLLNIQMTMQLIMATALEGRTSHYVKLLDSPQSDDSAKRLTCPVFSIRPANKTTKYYKYTVTEDQFAKAEDWSLNSTVVTFKDCAYLAASQGYMMFMFVDNECSVSNSLYTRLTEPCANETATVVYMAEAPETSCHAGTYLVVLDGASAIETICDIPPPAFSCENGDLMLLSLIVVVRIRGQCTFLMPQGSNTDHEQQSSTCGQGIGGKPCSPTDSDNRGTFVQHLNDVSRNAKRQFYVDLEYETPSGNWTWRNTGIVQPTGVPGEWDESNLLSDYAGNPYAYMFPTGLSNKVDPNTTYTCCVRP